MSPRFEIKSSVLPDDATVTAFRGSEGISRPYCFDVYLNVVGAEDVEVDDAPGAKVTLTIDDPDTGIPVHVNGVVAAAELIRSVSMGALNEQNSLYLVRIVPNLWFLSLTKHSRIWTEKSIPDIIKDVLQAEGVDKFELRLKGSYDPEEHVCQYKESSLNFIQRWMERLGMYYFFEQGDDGETLIITDSNSTSTPSRVLPVPYHPSNGNNAIAGPHFDEFTWRNAALPSAIKFTDYDYNKPALEVEGSASVSKIGVGEQVTYGSRVFTAAQGKTLANVRAEDLRAQAKTFHGGGPANSVTSGYRFLVDGHPKLQLNIEYLAVSVEHYGYTANAVMWGKAIPHDTTDVYRIDVVAIDATQQYRHPEVSPWPRLDGYENAVVDGPASSEYAQIDSHGRYNLKFKFDEGTLKGGKASTWVRKMQPHAGTTEGWHFPERAGTEVICAFLGGDPDRPIIIGAIPTITTPSPVTSANHTKNVIQTGGKNRYEMEDLAGQQRVTISTPHAKTFMSLGHPLTGLSQVYNGDGEGPVEGFEMVFGTDKNSLLVVGEDHKVDVDGNQDIDIKLNKVEAVHGDYEQFVHGFVERLVDGTVTEAYGKAHCQTVLTGGQSIKVEAGGQTVDIHGKQTTEIHGSQDYTVSANQKYTVEGNQILEIKGTKLHKVLGVHTEMFESAKTERVAGAIQNMFLGAKSEFVGGAKFDEVLGARVDMTVGGHLEINVALCLEINAAAKWNISPLCCNFEAAKNSLHAEKAEVKANQSDLVAMKTAVEALASSTHALRNTVSACKSKKAGLTSSMNALDSKMNGLTDIK